MNSRYTLADLAARFDLQTQGDTGTVIDGVGTLSSAGCGQLTFLANTRYAAKLANTHASAVVLSAETADGCLAPALIARDPYLAFAKIATLFEKQPATTTGVHPTVVMADSADISASASVGPYCTIGDNARIEEGAVLGPYCMIGPDCVVGAQSRLVARVTLVIRVQLGRRVLLHPGTVIGADGFGIAIDDGHWTKVPQLGGVCIGDDCEVGANTTIDRGALEDTVLAEDVRLDNQIQIAHNVNIGAHTAMAGCSAVAGSTRIGRWCLVGGNAGILGHLEVADRVTITAKSLVTHSIREPGEYSSGMPLQENRLWRRNAARIKKLDQYMRRLLALERKDHD